jgi:hypothetical protein
LEDAFASIAGRCDNGCGLRDNVRAIAFVVGE